MKCLRAKGLRPLNRPNCREVLECGSALPLWDWVRRLESGRALPHSKTLARTPRLVRVQGRKARQKVRAFYPNAKSSHLPFPNASDTGVQAENMTTSLLCTTEDKRLAVAES
jgi:hypothetical protein